MESDLLDQAAWICCSTAPASASRPSDLASFAPEWLVASVPGTAAAALRAADPGRVSAEDFDTSDWWWHTTVTVADAATAILVSDGIATIADVFVNDAAVFHGENMFRRVSIEVQLVSGDNDIAICCRALEPLLRMRRARPRWRTRLVEHQSLRWFRTTLLGRIPGWAGTAAPVGPWRGLRLLTSDGPRIVWRQISTRCDGPDGIVEVLLELDGPPDIDAVLSCRVGAVTAPLEREGDGSRLRGTVRVPNVELWWPHTHGHPYQYRTTVQVDTQEFDLPDVGFRTIEVDRRGGGFSIVVNGIPVFCRGACWVPLDPISLQTDPDELRAMLELVRLAHLNLLRIPGTMVYEERRFFDLCDELGILVWQDCMFANFDLPDDEAFEQQVRAEVTEVFRGLGGRPCLAVVSGGSEIEQQGAMNGVDPSTCTPGILTETLPSLMASLLPGVAYIPSSPTGGDLPFRCDTGIAHYFGVGAYLRNLEDVRRAGVRFAAECLAFATPPDPETIEEIFGGAAPAGHDPRWKRAIPRDSGAPWDFEDVTTHYVRELFGVDPLRVRYRDPERALDFARAAVTECVAAVFSEWRRPDSGCAGGIVLSLRDLEPGAGWGLIDALGRPKAPWFTLRRLLAPIAVTATDEGLNGLRLRLFNDTPLGLRAELDLELLSDDVVVGQATASVMVCAHGGTEIDADAMLGGFRDANYAYRFGPPTHDALVATLRNADGQVLSELVHLPLGLATAERDLGLRATASPCAGGTWELVLRTDRLAQFVAFEVPGFLADDAWFHLAPNRSKVVLLAPVGSQDVPRGHVRALNGTRHIPITIAAHTETVAR